MKHSLKQWILATRPWSFPASAMPALVAISFVFFLKHTNITMLNINWLNGILALIGAVIFQIAGNLISDYFDFKHNVDRKETFGSSRLLVDGVFLPETILKFGFVMLVIGSLIGIYLLFNSGMQLLWIGAIGVVCAYFYYFFKYRAFGDAVIFLVYGLLIALGTYYVMTGTLNLLILLISMPVGFLVDNILHANNTRDILHDGVADIKTQAMQIGIRASKIQYSVSTFGSYLIVTLLVIFGKLHPICLLVFLTLPIAIKNIKTMQTAQIDKPEKIKNLDGASAQLVMIFSLVFALSNFIGAMI